MIANLKRENTRSIFHNHLSTHYDCSWPNFYDSGELIPKCDNGPLACISHAVTLKLPYRLQSRYTTYSRQELRFEPYQGLWLTISKPTFNFSHILELITSLLMN
jgi:hypothetical protein